MFIYLQIYTVYAMGRHRVSNPVVKRTIQVSDTSYNFLHRYRSNAAEPFYRAVDRLIGYYKQKDIAQVVEQFEQCKRNMAKLYDRIHELEAENKALEKKQRKISEYVMVANK